ncbi:MAG TPA: hypothetical protein VKB20_05465, partial [Steroidobacteraceae bacterium]|nr:hypothetical protein [Steroidobacteraceae bacterium]
GVDYIAGNSAIDENIDRAARGTGVTLIDVPVRDGVSVLSAAARGRGKAALKSVLGTRLGPLRRWLRR